jgi:hypothetical protein
MGRRVMCLWSLENTMLMITAFDLHVSVHSLESRRDNNAFMTKTGKGVSAGNR